MTLRQNSISLQFPDMRVLWQFAQTLTCMSIEIKPTNKVLICSCSTDEINRAVTMYGAKILEGTLEKAMA